MSLAASSNLSGSHVISILNFIRFLKQNSLSPDHFVSKMKEGRWLRTSNGSRSPDGSVLYSEEWKIARQISKIPFIKKDGYGEDINCFKPELQLLGVIVDFNGNYQMVVDNVFNSVPLIDHKFYGSRITTRKNELKQLGVKTRLGDYRSPRDCILNGPEWESISAVTLLPFIDDGDNFYGKGIREYEKELKKMGVVVEFKDEKDYSFPDNFRKHVRREWLKTHVGYRTPDNCCLFDSKWGLYLKSTDGPFIDEVFYGSNISSYREELRSIGVTVEAEKACPLLASNLCYHSEFSTIVRIFNFLSKHKWMPESDATRKIWIPDGHKNGKWVNPEECVLHNRDGLFGQQFTFLEEYYEPNLLCFFSTAFNVTSNPSLDSHCKLWKVWETSGYQLSHAQCCAFWECVVGQWSSEVERTLADGLMKLPVHSGRGEILLLDKNDVFVADDLLLKELFENHSPRPVLVWYPQPGLPSLPRRKEMVRLILGFLADPSLKMEMRERHEAVQCLLNITALKPDKAGGPKARLEYATCLSEAIAGGVLWDKEVNINALCELIKFAVLVNFNEEAVQFLMKSKNLQIFEEDEEFLSAAFP
ncbi:hypothetical protein OIU76_022411 [Salix suchowensis]|nr:hypothetical protein OIU76_022411 [Salix suchowensis]